MNKESKNKKGLIIGCAVGVVVIAAIIVTVVLLMKGGEKTVSCNMSQTVMGVTANSEANVKVTNGKVLGGDMTVKIDLKSLSDFYKSYESEMADSMINSFKKQCTENCTFNHAYTAGDNITITMEYDENGVSNMVRTYGAENMSAQAIADKIQETFEKQTGTTCTQH